MAAPGAGLGLFCEEWKGSIVNNGMGQQPGSCKTHSCVRKKKTQVTQEGEMFGRGGGLWEATVPGVC